MKVLIVGGGGREHAIAWKCSQSKRVTELYAAPGNAGIAQLATCVDISVMDAEKLVAFAKEKEIDLAIVGPDDPLVAGVADAFMDAGIRVFGPRANAAIIEGSKAFSKDLMKKYGIPSAAYETFDNADAALAYLETAKMPIVLKADGLALGKGVLICNTLEEAKTGVKTLMLDKQFGDAGNEIVIEEFMTGREVSVLCYCDGTHIKPMTSAQDHKRAKDGDQGLNTGGMGTVAPNPYYTKEIAKTCMETIFLPTIRAMKAEGRPFTGCLYFGLMLTEKGPKVIEYNCRFGDPETQVVLPLLESDLLTVMQATTAGTLTPDLVRFSDDCACCVIMASKGYPVKYQSGYELDIPDFREGEVYIAGAKAEEDKLVTAGGRVLGAVATAKTLEEAIRKAYGMVSEIRFENAYYRQDIGKRALLKKEEH